MIYKWTSIKNGGEFMQVLISIGAGALFGFATAVTGIAKNKPNGERIDLKKAIPTVVVTAIAGGVVGANGLPITEASLTTITAGLATVGATEWITNIVKGIYTKFFG